MEAISARSLKKTYITYLRRGFRRERKIVKALRGVSFEVRYGEVFGLLGPNGAGKTTTVKILATLLLPDSGEATVAGFDVVRQPSEVRRRIGVTLTVERGFFWKLTGRENLKYFGLLRGLRGSTLDSRVRELLRLTGLEELGASDKLYEEYSLGMKAKLSLARALLADPPVLMLDEPTLGLDPSSAREVRELLVKLAREEEKAVLVTTHNMWEAEMICDRVAIISQGTIAAIGSVSELKKLAPKKSVLKVLLKAPNTDRLKDAVDWIGEEDSWTAVRVYCEPGGEGEALATIASMVAELGGRVYRVELSEPTLEDVFIELTKGGACQQ